MRLVSWIVIQCFFASAAFVSAAITDPVKIEAGLVSGTSGAGPDVRIYRGIPYAVPPTGSLRWRPPQPVAHWDGARKAEQFGPRCMQASGGPVAAGGPGMNEDCLYLNVWTAAATAAERRPVIVWSHPGGYTSGSGQYDGEPLANKGVVLVTYNYRLGVFGFFSHPELTKESGRNASGNQALMDMVEVLRWVKKNISGFGGDPNRVTIAGDSAGAAMGGGMTGSPEGKGLFHRAISESGAWMGLSMSPMVPLAQAEENGNRLAAAVGANSLADLRALPADVLQQKGRGSGMIIDGWYIPEDLSLTFAQGRQNQIDVLVGSNKDEGTFFAGRGASSEQFASQMRQRWGDLADSFFKLYPAGSDTETNVSSLARFRDELGWHQRTWAKLQEKLSNALGGKLKVYVYYFTHEPPAAAGQPSRGATHGAEAAYVFNTPGPLWTDADRALAEQVSSYWVNFAASGNPNGKGLPTWPAYHFGKSDQPMVLGEKIDIEPGPSRMALFDALYARQTPR